MNQLLSEHSVPAYLRSRVETTTSQTVAPENAVNIRALL